MDSRELILISSGNANDLRMLHALLSAQGYEIITAGDIDSLRAQFKKHLPGVVLIDCDLAGDETANVCGLLKSEAYNSSVQFIGIVPLLDTQVHSAMLNAGADDLVFRPFSSDEIIIRVRGSIERQHLAEESFNLEKLLFSLASAFEAREESKVGHPERVARMSRRLGERIGLSFDEQEALYKGGMLHDIGMLKVPKHILEKPGPLTSEEYEIMKLHTIWGERMCRPVRSLQQLLPILRHHHEQIDGKGYPDGLSGDDIPTLARVLAISEVFDALVSDRPYRTRLKQEDALRYIKEYAQRRWLHADLVGEFLSMVDDEGWPLVPATELHPEAQARAKQAEAQADTKAEQKESAEAE